MAFWDDWDLNPLDEGGVFGSGDAEDAKDLDKEAIKEWEGFINQLRTLDPTLDWGTDVKPFEVGAGLDPVKQMFLDPGDSAFEGLDSAYTGLGPSAYRGLGPSAYSDLAFDPGRMTEAEDYFGEVMRDPIDDIAEADYARRQAAAEQARKANVDAAMRDLEARGQGAASDALLAEITGAQGSTSDQYQAGLDANALAQARRDAAAGSLADVAGRKASGTLTADTARAGGVDAFDTARAGGIDSYGTTVAGGQDAFAGEQAGGLDEWGRAAWDDFYDLQEWNANEMSGTNRANWDRENTVSDTNTGAWNQNQAWNQWGGPAEHGRMLMEAYGHKTGTMGGAAAGLRQSATYPFQDIFLPAGSAFAQGYGASQSGGKK